MGPIQSIKKFIERDSDFIIRVQKNFVGRIYADYKNIDVYNKILELQESLEILGINYFHKDFESQKNIKNHYSPAYTFDKEFQIVLNKKAMEKIADMGIDFPNRRYLEKDKEPEFFAKGNLNWNLDREKIVMYYSRPLDEEDRDHIKNTKKLQLIPGIITNLSKDLKKLGLESLSHNNSNVLDHKPSFYENKTTGRCFIGIPGVRKIINLGVELKLHDFRGKSKLMNFVNIPPSKESRTWASQVLSGIGRQGEGAEMEF